MHILFILVLLIYFINETLVQGAINVSDKCFTSPEVKSRIPQCIIEFDSLYRQRCVENEGMFISLENDVTKDFKIVCYARYPMNVAMKLESDHFIQYSQGERGMVIHGRKHDANDHANLNRSVNSSLLHFVKIPILSQKEESLKKFVTLREVNVGPAGEEGMMAGLDRDVKFMLLHSGNDLFTLGPLKVRPTSDLVYIPCQYDYSGRSRKLFLTVPDDDGGSRKINHTSDNYNVFDGFKLNLTTTPMLYGDYEYSCYTETSSENQLIEGAAASRIGLGVDYIKGLFVSPKMEHLECFNLPCSVRCENDQPISLLINENEADEKVVESQLLFRSFENFTRYGVEYSFNDAKNRDLIVNCRRKSDNEILHSWKVTVENILASSSVGGQSLYMELTNASTMSSDRTSLKCYSTLVEIKSFFALTCSNRIECDLYMGCAKQFNGARKSKESTTSNLGNCSPQIQHSQSCSDIQNMCLEIELNSYGGRLFCEGENNVTYNANYIIGMNKVLYLEQDFERLRPDALISIKMEGRSHLIFSGGRYTFQCSSHYFITEHGLEWKLKLRNGSDVIPFIQEDSYEIESDISTSDTFPKRETSITLYSDVVSVVCSAPYISSNSWVELEFPVSVREGKPVTIINPIPKILDAEIGKEITVECKADGLPKPKVEWIFPQIISNISMMQNSPIMQSQEGTATLKFPSFSGSFIGDYTCFASNGIANITQTMTVTVKTRNWLVLILSVTSIAIITLMCMMCILYRRWIMTRNALQRITDEELNEFLTGVNTIYEGGNDGFGMSHALAVPYDKRFEIDKDMINIEKDCPLGSGQFGQVYKASLRINQVSHEVSTAVKTLKGLSSASEIVNMLNEIKVMIYMGEHENLVRFLGAVTKECQKGNIYMVLEFCEKGSLEDHLRTNNSHYENSLKTAVGKSNWAYTKLMRFCYQIACGMEYIASKNVVHGDLACRNVLLKMEDNIEVAKISDFGLSRRMYEYAQYVKTKQQPLPWKYLSVEALLQLKFSTKSDVWAWGITVWEIFSLGDTPYPGFAFNNDFLELLKNGYRNSKPKYAEDNVYKLLLQCWSHMPANRPDFTQIRSFLKDSPTPPVSSDALSFSGYLNLQDKN